MVGGERTTCASTASSLKLRRANARRPLTHSTDEHLVGSRTQEWAHNLLRHETLRYRKNTHNTIYTLLEEQTPKTQLAGGLLIARRRTPANNHVHCASHYECLHQDIMVLSRNRMLTELRTSKLHIQALLWLNACRDSSNLNTKEASYLFACWRLGTGKQPACCKHALELVSVYPE